MYIFKYAAFHFNQHHSHSSAYVVNNALYNCINNNKKHSMEGANYRPLMSNGTSGQMFSVNKENNNSNLLDYD